MYLNIVVSAVIIGIGILYHRKGSVKIWLVILALLVIGNVVAYFAHLQLKNKTRSVTENTHKMSRNAFVASLKDNEDIIRAIYTEQGFLAITVVNDGEDKTEMAIYYCDLAKSENVYVAGVKILDAADTKFGKTYAYGTELAEAYCY